MATMWSTSPSAPQSQSDRLRARMSRSPPSDRRRRAAPSSTRAACRADGARRRWSTTASTTAEHDADTRPRGTTPTSASRATRARRGRLRRRATSPCRSPTLSTSVDRGWNAERAVERRTTREVERPLELEAVGHAPTLEDGRCGCSASRGGSCSGRSNLRMPASSLGTSVASSHGALRGRQQGRPRRHGSPRPVGVEPEPRPVLSTVTTPTLQPAGKEATQGTDVAEGTDCAISTIRLLVPHSGDPLTSTCSSCRERTATRSASRRAGHRRRGPGSAPPA